MTRVYQRVGPFLLLAVLISLPIFFRNPAFTSIGVLTLMFAAAAAAWNIFSGFTGYIALGHAAFFGIGSYAMALMCKDWNVPGGYMPFLLVPLAGIVSALFSIPIGWISLRTRRHTFVVITIAIFFIMQPMAFNLRSITNGSIGLNLPIPLWTGEQFNRPFYYVALAILLLAFLAAWWVRNSKYGLGLLAIRDDEDRARGLGVKTGPYKLIAFIISAFFVGMIGGLHAYFQGSIFPAFAFDPLFDLAIALMSFLGGLGTLAGPILGAFILEPTQRYFTYQFSQNGVYLIIYGAFFLAIILLLPEGIIPTLQKLWRNRRSAMEPARTMAARKNSTSADPSPQLAEQRPKGRL
jgi:branched-chain amino acid transport system permease protein